jgi:hypothetical protein
MNIVFELLIDGGFIKRYRFNPKNLKFIPKGRGLVEKV